MARSRRTLSVLLLAGATSAGLFAGLSVAAGGLALDGRSLIEGSVERNEMFLVLGPLLGLLPVSAFALAASRSPALAARGPVLLGTWVLCAAIAVSVFGVYPFLH